MSAFLIVVSKLLTGFDAPRNTVLYVCRSLVEHNLLQAIARVNRLYEGKDFGYILDYYGVLQELGNVMDVYGHLPGFEAKDLEGTVLDVASEVASLPQKHSELWHVFRGVKNRLDEEEYEKLLADEELRARFYEKLCAFHKALSIALSTMEFLRDTHVSAEGVEQITPPVRVFEREAFQAEVDKLKTAASKVDTIAHRTQKTITEKMDENPVLYRKFSKILQEAIDAYRAMRISEVEYLNKATHAMNAVLSRTGDSLPSALQGRDVAKAFYGVVSEVIEGLAIKEETKRVRWPVEKWYLDHAQAAFARSLAACLSKLHGRVNGVPRLHLRRMPKRWGSWTRRGAIYLNPELVRAPGSCIDYVVTHELCHLVYANHGEDFFALLRKTMPDWEARKARLETTMAN